MILSAFGGERPITEKPAPNSEEMLLGNRSPEVQARALWHSSPSEGTDVLQEGDTGAELSFQKPLMHADLLPGVVPILTESAPLSNANVANYMHCTTV